MIECKQCHGTGLIFFLHSAPIKCGICEGAGETEDNILWRVHGKIISDYRKHMRIGLREFARKHELDPSNLKKMEMGVIKPAASVVYLILQVWRPHVTTTP